MLHTPYNLIRIIKYSTIDMICCIRHIYQTYQVLSRTFNQTSHNYIKSNNLYLYQASHEPKSLKKKSRAQPITKCS